MHIPDSFTWSVCSPQANPVEFDDEKPPASLSQREESRGALCMGLRRNFSKDEPESRAHDEENPTLPLWDQQTREGGRDVNRDSHDR